jgi:hypothetical protein
MSLSFSLTKNKPSKKLVEAYLLASSCWSLPWLILRHNHSKRRLIFNELLGVICQEDRIILFLFVLNYLVSRKNIHLIKAFNCIRLIWLRIGTDEHSYEHGNEPSGSIKWWDYFLSGCAIGSFLRRAQLHK